MKKTITLLFCIGLFSVSFAQRGSKQTRRNNGENQVAQSYGNNQHNVENQHSTWGDGSYKGGGQRSNSDYASRNNGDRHERGYSNQRETYGERDWHEGYQRRSDNRWNRQDENRYRRHHGFLWFR